MLPAYSSASKIKIKIPDSSDVAGLSAAIWVNDFNVWMIDYLYCLLRDLHFKSNLFSLKNHKVVEFH